MHSLNHVYDGYIVYLLKIAQLLYIFFLNSILYRTIVAIIIGNFFIQLHTRPAFILLSDMYLAEEFSRLIDIQIYT